MGWERERTGIDRRGVGEGETGELGGGESGDRQEEEWVGEGESEYMSGVGGGQWGTRGGVWWEGERVGIDRRGSGTGREWG